MPRLVFQRLSNIFLRRLVCGTLLVVLSVGMTGFALPVPKALSRSTIATERFPCESCPCGCSTAEFCWDKCCCHSDEEKLRWADRNGVDAPKFLIDRVASKSAADDVAEPSPSCCCCDAASKTKAAPTTCEVAEAEADLVTHTRYVQLESVAKCRGIQMMWTLFSQLVIPPPRENISPMPRLLYRLQVIDERAVSVMSWQDPPVPRRV